MSCGDEGEWNVITPCHCNPGYELVEQCSGTLYMHIHVLHAHSFCTLSVYHTCTSDLSSQLEYPVGTYSEGVCNSPCEPCPANSLSTQTGMAECPCDLEYYRAPDERSQCGLHM